MKLELKNTEFPELVVVCKYHQTFKNDEFDQQLNGLKNGMPLKRSKNYNFDIGDRGFVVFFENTNRYILMHAFLAEITTKAPSVNTIFKYDFEYLPIKEIPSCNLFSKTFEFTSDQIYYQFKDPKKVI